MEKVTSQDGTTIAFERFGDGVPVILVGGALSDSRSGAAGVELAGLLSGCSAYVYDRRGRGDSGDTQPYAKEREFEDLQAVISAAGGTAAVYGHSSGAILALEAAEAGLPITRLALYEPPYAVPGGRTPLPDYVALLKAAIAEGRRADALHLFMVDTVGMPAEMFDGMRGMPMWPALEAVAHTLVYDGMFSEPGTPPMTTPVPTLVLSGADSPEFLRVAARAVPGTHRILEGQTHDVSPSALAPILADFFTA